MADYVHGTSASEQARLAALNQLRNARFLEFVELAGAASVLEVGSGLGLLAQAVAERAPAARVVGVEFAAAQLARAPRGGGVRFVQADAHRLPFGDGSFDVVYCRYLLEHVGDPERVLREMARVLRPGGRLYCEENDISLSRVDPPCPAYERAWAEFARLQEQLGGRPFIGRELYRLLRGAGLAAVELATAPEVHWAGSPGFALWVANLEGNLASGADALLARGMVTPGQLAAAVAELRALAARQDASATFHWNRASGTRPGLAVARAELTSEPALALIGALDRELEQRYPEEGACHFRLDVDEVAPGRGSFVVARLDGRPVACGALRKLDAQRGEIKRMYVAPEVRGRGVGRAVLLGLERQAAELGVRELVLETGVRQAEAIALYEKHGFRRIAAFGEYVNSPLSLCMAKSLVLLGESSAPRNFRRGALSGP